MSAIRKHRDKHRCSDTSPYSFRFIQISDPAHRIVPPIFRVGFPPTQLTSLETPSQTSSEVCLLADSKSSHLNALLVNFPSPDVQAMTHGALLEVVLCYRMARGPQDPAYIDATDGLSRFLSCHLTLFTPILVTTTYLSCSTVPSTWWHSVHICSINECTQRPFGQSQWHVSVIPDTWEGVAGGSLESRSSQPV